MDCRIVNNIMGSLKGVSGLFQRCVNLDIVKAYGRINLLLKKDRPGA